MIRTGHKVAACVSFAAVLSVLVVWAAQKGQADKFYSSLAEGAAALSVLLAAFAYFFKGLQNEFGFAGGVVAVSYGLLKCLSYANSAPLPSLIYVVFVSTFILLLLNPSIRKLAGLSLGPPLTKAQVFFYWLFAFGTFGVFLVTAKAFW